MTTITREQQKQILIDTANHVISRDNTSPYSENLRELARIALAALTAEPVAWKYRLVDINSGTGEHWKYSTQCITPTSGKTHCIESVPLYTAPPAPDNKQRTNLLCGLSVYPTHSETPDQTASYTVLQWTI